MEIILKEDVTNLGSANEIITVRNGYARNYLIPRGVAIQATTSLKKAHQEIVKQKAYKEDRLRQKAMEIAENLKNKQIKVGAKVSTTGKIFGSVNTIMLAEAINKKGFEIDRKSIDLPEHIKEIGTYTATVKLHRDVKVEISFEVIAE